MALDLNLGKKKFRRKKRNSEDQTTTQSTTEKTSSTTQSTTKPLQTTTQSTTKPLQPAQRKTTEKTSSTTQSTTKPLQTTTQSTTQSTTNLPRETLIGNTDNSSGIQISSSSLPPEWDAIDYQPLNDQNISFGTLQLKRIMALGCNPTVVQQSIYHFAYALSVEWQPDGGGFKSSPLNYFLGCFRTTGFFESPEYLSMLKRRQTAETEFLQANEGFDQEDFLQGFFDKNSQQQALSDTSETP